MALDISIRISVDGDTAYSSTEAALIRALAAHPSNGAAAVVEAPADAPVKAPEPVKVEEPVTVEEPEKAEEVKPAPRKPTTRKPKAATVKAAPVEDVPMALDDLGDDPEQIEDKVAETTPEPAIEGKVVTQYTMSDAVTAATDNVKAGRQVLVRSALEAAGAERVSHLDTDAKLEAFFAVIEGR